MSLRRRLASRWRTLFQAARLDRDLHDELRAFAEERVAQHLARGLSHDAARRAVQLEMGSLEAVKHQVRDQRRGRWLVTVWRDLRHGVRLIARAPAFSVVVVLTLGLVVGATASVFSVMHAVLWRGLPYPDADRFVLVGADVRGLRGASLAGGELREIGAERQVLDRLGAVYRVNAHVTVDDEMEQVPAASVTDGALELLGALPLAHGRLLDAGRDLGRDGYARSVIVSHDLWMRRLGADPRVVGRRIEINNTLLEVVGVLRPDFRLLLPASTALPESPGIVFPREVGQDYRFRASVPSAIGRLAPGVSLTQARGRLEVLADRLQHDHPADYADAGLRLSITPLRTALTADVRPALWALALAVGFVLLVGCVNVGNLLLARSWTRLPEMAVRQALGARRLRLVVQLLTETAILAACGGLLGLLLAHLGVAALDWLQPRHLPRQTEVAVNGTVMAVVTLLSVATTLLAGLLPAVTVARATADQSHRTARADVQRGGLRRLQRALMVAEVSLCVVPLVAGGLMLHTFVNMMHAPLGFEPDNVLTAKVPLSLKLLSTPEERLRMLTSAIREVGRLEGVRAVSAGGPLPLDHQFQQPYGLPDTGMPLASEATIQAVLPGYLSVTGVRLEAGRDFRHDEIAARAPVVIVDGRIARQLWPDGALGRRIAIGQGATPRTFEIIGVARPVRALAVRDETMPHVFVPYDQFGLVMSLVVATDRPADSIGPAIKRTVEALGTRRPVHDILPMRTYVDRSMGDTRFTMFVVMAFGAAALTLAGVGLYGTLSYLTAQRRQEFGVRMALGASAGRVVTEVVREGLVLALAGTLLGTLGAVVAGGLLRDLLYGVSSFDGSTLAAVAALVALVAVAATVHPAVHAARTDPAAALRGE